MGGEPDTDAMQYAALAEEMRQEDLAEGREPGDYGPPDEQDMVPRAALEHEQQRTDAILAAHREARDRRSAPDVMEDPVRHFDQRMAALEDQKTLSQFADAGRTADAEGRQEYSDYNDMIAHLHQVAFREAERQAGRRMTEPERENYLRGATMAVMQQAAQQGIGVAQYARQLALENGYQSPIALGKSEYGRLADALDKAGDSEQFDRLWDAYARAERKAERAAGRRR